MLFMSSWLLVSCSMENTAVVTVTNKSGKNIRSLDIEVAGKNQHIDNLQNGNSTSVEFRGFGDSGYKIKGVMEHGTPFGDEVGYVTNGMNFHDSIVIRENGKIEFDSLP